MTDTTNPESGESSAMSLSEAGDAFLGLFNQEETAADDSPTSEEPVDAPEVVEEETPEEEVEESEQPEAADDQPEAESEEEDSNDPEGFIIELDGEQLTEQQLRDIKQAGLREDDYRRKTQALAEERKAWEEQRQQDEAAFKAQWEERLAIGINAAADALEEFNNVDWDELRATDPIEYQTKWIDYQRAQAQANELTRQAQEALSADAQRTQAEMDAYKQEQMALARERIPELNDPDKAPKLVSDLTTYMQKEGFSMDEINNLTDAKAISVLHKAMKWEALQQEAATTPKKVTRKAKVIKPGSGSETAAAAKAEKEAKAKSNKMKRFRDRGGNAKDAAELFLELGLK